MTNNEILDKYNSKEINCIYGFMYGHKYINTFDKGLIPDKIIKINKKDLQLGIKNDCFVYVWGYPGPDANIYKFEDYGETWAFTKKELI
jgi:hypothetical protein